jgi:hypothetical protein
VWVILNSGIGVREALATILRYVVITDGTLVILQSSGIDLTSLNVFVGAIGVGLGFGLHVWSAEHVKTAGALKSDLNFEVWRQLGAAGVSIQPAALPPGVRLTKPSG